MLKYPFEAPRSGASYEYQNICFRREIRKNIYFIPHFICSHDFRIRMARLFKVFRYNTKPLKNATLLHSDIKIEHVRENKLYM